MPSEKVPFYDPTPPSYDEALAGGSRWVPPARDTADQRGATQTEQQSLLRQPGNGESSRRTGYHAPTVETDDESENDDGLLSDDDSEEEQVRREIEEMDMEEPDRSLSSTWRKRLRIPSWKWSWRPRLPRLRIQLPSRPADGDTQTQTTQSEEPSAGSGPRFNLDNFQIPKVNTMFLVLTFARILAIFIIIGFFWFLFTSGLFSGLNSPLTSGMRFNAEDLRNFLQQRVEPMRMRASVQHYSSYAHLAGTEGDYAAARDVYAMFSKAGLDRVTMEEYFVYINYPRHDGRNVQLLDGSGTATWTAKLDEDEHHHETAGRQTYAFHAHSKSGDVRGPLIYVNYGSKADYEKLKKDGIMTEGAIALVRNGGTEKSTALKVKLAEMHGFVGALVYNDPKEDGFSLGDVAPQGRFLPADGVHGDSVSLMNWILGDVLTPQWESEEQAPRVKVSDAVGLVQIPSLPLAWRDAQPLLQSLKGHGQKVHPDWTGAVPDVEWWTGDGSSPTVRLQNEQDEVEKQKIWNVYGRIEGMETASKSILIGNHRDSMGFGASNPHTGTAVMIELARIFGDLVDRGWKPLRSIEFMSWDASEYNLIGSTEFVEKNLDRLKKDAYAYIDLSDAVTGTSFKAAGSPLLERALLHALSRVVDPGANETLKTLWDRANTQLLDLSTGAAPSDYIPFQDVAGTSSMHLGFASAEDAAYPYRSSYDTFELVDQVVDPGFVYHGLLGQVVGLLLLDLADRAILPFDTKRYGDKLQTWLGNLETWSRNRGAGDRLSFEELKDAAGMVQHNAEKFGQWELEWDSAVLASNGWESNEYGAARTEYNDKMAQFETALLDPDFGGGIPNRTQFKHIVFGPPLLSTNDEALFPAIRDLIEAEDWTGAKDVMAKTAALLRHAGALLSMSMS
ncbi:glutamate carboxypeptidase [Cordyceps militaris]|uniref:Glutamate carboxypeptidase n=1 Tax=Cordyceps militaris TaxID=73501 RepID=A0A2H4SRD6_CORMI|nr:glutamate carboxypeptidase [Cordyceps militaris]